MLEGQQVPPRWVRPPERVVGASPGMHRFAWDLRYERPGGVRQGYPISAIDGYTPAEPRGPIALPGTYTVRLTVDGVVQTQPLTIVDGPPRDDLTRRPAAAVRSVAAHQERARPARRRFAHPELRRLAGELETLYRILQGSDQAPTPVTVQLAEERLSAAERLLGG